MFVSEIMRDINETFNKNTKLRGLDFGCGIGTHTIIFNDFNIDAHGIDISSSI